MATPQKRIPASLAPKAESALKATVSRRKASPASERTFAASSAKTHLLQLLDEVDTGRREIIITKRGRPVARLVPIEEKPSGSIFGCMKGTFKITGDIVGPEPDIWEAME